MTTPKIAIVGMAARVPGARNVQEFWENLRNGVESILPLTDAELLAAGVAPEDLDRDDYVKAAARLADVEMFDASFFGFSPRDAAIMDPQHRHFLECAWEALENAGHVPERFSGSIGVFAGSGLNAYLIHNLLKNRRLLNSVGLFLIKQTGNDKDVLATRVSYQFDLRGSSLNIQTACSSSLVAVHAACQSLLNCECDMALAGGVTIEVPHGQGYIYREGEILSRDGHCRSFDASSSGTVFSSGVGIVVLRRLEDAIRDHDTIHAVIVGSAVNNDGQRKVGYLAPSVVGQAEVIAEALGVAGVSADSISYVETHGTGTAVGDPIEIKGLTQAFRKDTDRSGYCAIGSLKTNVGHLDAASGVASLIKTSLALRHKQLPASLNYDRANPQIDFPNTPFYVNTSLAEWKANERPRRAGVTSLGIGGTNAHVVLEEGPEPVESASNIRPYELIPLSAKTKSALDKVTDRLATHLQENPSLSLAEVAFTCQEGRAAFRHRRFVVAGSLTEAAMQLASPDLARRSIESGTAPSMVFIFSGQGSQHINMGADLYAHEIVFRDCLDSCAEILLPHLGVDLRRILFPSQEQFSSAVEQLNCTDIAQPALFALEYSLAQWWMAHGVHPQAMVGHSVGEYVAACLSDVLSQEDALAMVSVRGRMMQACASGAMLAIDLAPESISLPNGISLAAINGPRQCVISGTEEAVSEMQQQLEAQEVTVHRLRVTRAFHSAMMDPILASFSEQMRRVTLRPPRIPFLSNRSGTWITEEEATDPEYWVAHLRNTVRFSECVVELLQQSNRVFLEIGPGRTLADLVLQHAGRNGTDIRSRVCSSLPHRDESVPDSVFALRTLGHLWSMGQTVPWSSFRAGKPVRRIELPTYPFERQRYWIDPDSATQMSHAQPHASSSSEETGSTANATDATNERNIDLTNIEYWCYQRQWRRTEQPSTASLPAGRWMVFMDSLGLGKQITHQLRGARQTVIEVLPGTAFKKSGSGRYTIRPKSRGDYDRLIADVLKQEVIPERIVHLWSVRGKSSEPSLDEKLGYCFYSLLYLAQAIGDQDGSHCDIAVVSDRIHSTDGELVFDPVCATLLGPSRVIPKELPGIACRNIDIDTDSQTTGQLAVQIIAEHCSPFRDPVVAWRRDHRWVEHMEKSNLLAGSGSHRLRQEGVYLITGGLGDLGLEIAEELSRSFKARLVLMNRTPIPSVDQWKSAIAAPETSPRVRQKIEQLMRIQSLGGKVLIVSGDVTRRGDLERAIEHAGATFGAINGVIHAAGVVEDGPLQVKTQDSAACVLEPKVQGTMVLNDVVSTMSLDFFTLFSSVSAFVAPAGQVDYTAANAFLDAFATSRRDANVISINWGPWQDVGIAARTSSSHPLLGRRLVNTTDNITYAISLSQERHWVLAEHCSTTGQALLPGTCYLEMATAALIDDSFDCGVEFEDVFFLAPLFADKREIKNVRLQLKRIDDGAYQFAFRTVSGERTEHASGAVTRWKQPPPQDQSLSEIMARCREQTLVFDQTHRTKQEKFFEFGPRWHNLRAVHLGKNEALAELELPEAYEQDTIQYYFHPAMFDIATGLALYSIDNYEQSQSIYLPLSYKRIRIYRRFPSKIYSYVRGRRDNTVGREMATFDVLILDAQGAVLAEIEEFSMRLVRDPQNVFATGRLSSAGVQNHAGFEGLPGIPPADGAKAFTRIFSADFPANLIIFPGGLASLRASSQIAPRSPVRQVASRGDSVESHLSEWWQELLGVERVELDDDFFDLGGHSLIVVRLFSKIQKTYGVNLGLSTLFDARTVRQLAGLIRDAGTSTRPQSTHSPAIVAIQAMGTRPPLFVISGIGGNVIKFHSLAALLGDDQPVFGLLPRGLDGREPYHTRIEDMASYYVDAILAAQTVGPYQLAGYSFGGTVAFEVAQQIVARGETVGLLGLFDTIEWHYLQKVGKLPRTRNRDTVPASQLGNGDADDTPVRSLRERVRSKAARTIYRLFDGLGQPVPRTVGTIEDINAFAGTRYRPLVYPGKVTLFRATDRGPLDGDDEFLGWEGLAAGGFEVHHVSATHWNILQEPAVKSLSEKLRQCLHPHPVVVPEPGSGGLAKGDRSASQQNSNAVPVIR